MKQRLYNAEPVTEMAIVDVFTQLIFDAEAALDDSGVLYLNLLSQLKPALLEANRRDISEYLRSMDVSEMIAIVSQLKTVIDQRQLLLTQSSNSQLKLVLS